jgi:hypothetical protein
VSQVDIVLGGPYGIHNGTHAAMRAAGIACSVAYPEQLMDQVPAPILNVIQDNVSVLPGNPMKDMFLGDLAKKVFDLPDKTNIAVTVTAYDVDKAVDIIRRCAGSM